MEAKRQHLKAKDTSTVTDSRDAQAIKCLYPQRSLAVASYSVLKNEIHEQSTTVFLDLYKEKFLVW